MENKNYEVGNLIELQEEWCSGDDEIYKPGTLGVVIDAENGPWADFHKQRMVLWVKWPTGYVGAVFPERIKKVGVGE